jgi:hypothetical protein
MHFFAFSKWRSLVSRRTPLLRRSTRRWGGSPRSSGWFVGLFFLVLSVLTVKVHAIIALLLFLVIDFGRCGPNILVVLFVHLEMHTLLGLWRLSNRRRALLACVGALKSALLDGLFIRFLLLAG